LVRAIDLRKLSIQHSSLWGQLAATALYAHGAGPDEPLVWYELTGGPLRRYLHADHQGSVIASNDDAGNLVGLAAPSPYVLLRPHGASCSRINSVAAQINEQFNCSVNYCFYRRQLPVTQTAQ
jgi:hypothetical protein